MFDGTNWFVQDLHSTNGTWINGAQLLPDKKHILQLDDEIDFAHAEKFIFFITDNYDVILGLV